MKYNGFNVMVKENRDGIWISWTKQQPGISSWGTNKNGALKGIERAINEYIDLMKQKSNKSG